MGHHAIFSQTVAHYLAPIQEYLNDPAVSEVMINRSDEIYIERDGALHKTQAKFADEQAYEAAVNNILQFTGRSFSDPGSLIDARLPDGSRVHVAKSPCARFGMAMTIRKFAKAMLDMDWLVEIGSLTNEARQFLRMAVRAEANLLVAGGTSSGKTSLLNALSRDIPDDQRIVVIEDSAELQLQQDHVVSMETQPPDRYGRGEVTIGDLFRSSLRLRPDRVVIGEVRGGEALDMIQAMTSGHGGSMGTLHANNPHDALNRLETMALMSDVDLPLAALRSQVASAIDIVVQMNRRVGGRRVVTQISEVETLGPSGEYRLRDLFVEQADEAEEGASRLVPTGERSSLGRRLSPQERAALDESTKALLE